ncbi:MAG: methionyl-tRNA formyltransferase [Chthoniobacterales bacterium]
MRIVFIGTGEIGVPTLRALLRSPAHELIGVVTQPDKPVGRDQHIHAPPIKAELAGNPVPVFQPKRIRAEGAVAEIRALAPDLIVIMAYGQILPRSVLDIPPIACLNLHASLLPRHRGAAPIQATIVAGDAETGITVMYVDEGLDTGDILLQKKLPILPDETGGSLHDRLARLAPEALLGALELLAKRNAPRIPQDSAQASYAPKLTREEGRINWKEPALVIERKIRAYDPWPGAFTQLASPSGTERNLKIFRAAVSEQSVGEPGMIITPNESELLVATGRGALRLEEVQLEGKRRMAASEFLRGFSSPRLHF